MQSSAVGSSTPSRDSNVRVVLRKSCNLNVTPLALTAELTSDVQPLIRALVRDDGNTSSLVVFACADSTARRRRHRNFVLHAGLCRVRRQHNPVIADIAQGRAGAWT